MEIKEKKRKRKRRGMREEKKEAGRKGGTLVGIDTIKFLRKI